MLSDAHFDAMLEEYQEHEAELAYERERLGDEQARRPDAVPLTITFADLRVGDFMTAEDPDDPAARWVEVVEVGAAVDSVFFKGQRDSMTVTFRTPQPIGVGMHDRWTIARPSGDQVVIDASSRPEES